MTILPAPARPSEFRGSLLVCGWLFLAPVLFFSCVSVPQTAVAPETRPSIVTPATAPPQGGGRAVASTFLADSLRLRSEGEYAKAIEQAQEALCLWRQDHDRRGEFEALFEIGSTYFKMSRKEEAALWYEEALRTAVAAGDRMSSAKAWNALGSALSEVRPDEARGCFEAAMSIWAESGDAAKQADVLFRIGYLLSSGGRVEEALGSYKRALPLAQSARDLRLSSDILNGMGTAYAALGESKEALDCYDRALRDARESQNRGAEAAISTGLGMLYRRRGEPQKALTTLEEALEINREIKDAGSEARVRNHLGPVYLDLGQPDRALAEYTEALRVLRSSEGNGIWIANTLINIGQVDLARGKFQEALDRFEEALKVSHEAGGSRDAVSLHHIGVARLRLEQVPEAVQSLDAALLLRRQADDRPGQAPTLLELGNAWQSQGDLQRAAVLMREALRIASEVGLSFIQAQSHFSLARLERGRGSLQEALAQIEQAIAILESMRSDLSDDRLRSSFFSSKRAFYDFWVDLLMRLDGQFPGQGYASRAFAASERGRARSLLDLLAEGRVDLTRGIDPELKKRESDTLARLAQIQRQLGEELSRKGNGSVADALRARLDDVEEERQKIELKIKAEHPLYAHVRYPSPMRLEEIQQQLEGDSALLEYSLGEEGAYLFVVTKQGLAVHTLPPPREIAEEVRKVRAGVEKPVLQTFSYLRPAHRLYEMLIAPARTDFAGRHRLLIAPDGPLHFLSFETLLSASPHGDGDLPYLLRDFSVSYIPSASVLSWLSSPQSPTGTGKEQGKKFLAFVDPDYSSEAPEARGADTNLHSSVLEHEEGWRFPRLQGSDREVSAIASRYPPAEVMIYQRREANEENVKKNQLVRTARRIHFATHGVLDEERPEFSGLALTQTDAPDDDGFLRVYEIFNLDLNADLVVLAACESGLGREVTGEGLVGLTRAFLYAGTPSVVVSLWRVNDAAAPDLMIRFYENLDRSGDKAEALRRAKLAMIQKGGKYSRPYYWAPFVLVGTPR